MPSYLDVAHHASTSLICWSYKASSLEPGFSASGMRWKESEGSLSDSGGVTGGKDEDILRRSVAEMVLTEVGEVVIHVTVRTGLAHVLKATDMEGGTLIVRNMILVVARL